MATPDSGNPTNLSELTAKQVSNGGGFVGILQPSERAAFVANATVAAGANPTKAEYDATVAIINSLKTTLVNLGLMKAS